MLSSRGRLARTVNMGFQAFPGESNAKFAKRVMFRSAMMSAVVANEDLKHPLMLRYCRFVKVHIPPRAVATKGSSSLLLVSSVNFTRVGE